MLVWSVCLEVPFSRSCFRRLEGNWKHIKYERRLSEQFGVLTTYSCMKPQRFSTTADETVQNKGDAVYGAGTDADRVDASRYGAVSLRKQQCLERNEECLVCGGLACYGKRSWKLLRAGGQVSHPRPHMFGCW